MESFNLEFEKLNKEQKAAILYNEGSLFLNSGAGTGKTKTLTMKIAYLIKVKNIEPKRILVLTFSNKAAKEMSDRTISLIGANVELNMSTFHSFCYQFLRKNISCINGLTNNFAIIDSQDIKSLLKEIFERKEIGVAIDNFSKFEDLIMKYKQNLYEYQITQKDLKELKISNDILYIYKLYQNECIKNNLLDFNDLQILTARILSEVESIRLEYQNLYDYILVDEFQDTDLIQYEILKLLNNNKTFAVGDPKQSIYGFRGARYENIKSFIKDFKAKEMLLSKNYRSTNSILNVANNLLNYEQVNFTNNRLFSDLGEGEIPKFNKFLTENEQATKIAQKIYYLTNDNSKYKKSDIAILYRSNYLKIMIEKELMNKNIPYVVYGTNPFYKTKEIKDLIAYFYLILDLNKDFYLKRILNISGNGIGKKTISEIENYAQENNISMFASLVRVNFPLNEKQEKYLTNFIKTIFQLNRDFETINISEFVGKLIDAVNYEEIILSNEPKKQIKIRTNIEMLDNVFKSKKIDKKKSNLENLEEILNELSLDNKDNEKKDVDAVVLSTIHQVKGLEFKVVFIVGLAEKIFPLTKNGVDILEEERIFYVAVTRAKEKLIFSYPMSKFSFTNNLTSLDMSRFLRKIL